jgi:hypothetical protein
VFCPVSFPSSTTAAPPSAVHNSTPLRIAYAFPFLLARGLLPTLQLSQGLCCAVLCCAAPPTRVSFRACGMVHAEADQRVGVRHRWFAFGQECHCKGDPTYGRGCAQREGRSLHNALHTVFPLSLSFLFPTSPCVVLPRVVSGFCFLAMPLCAHYSLLRKQSNCTFL